LTGSGLVTNCKLMKFSQEFETRFAEMLTHYPTRRSALVPTLLYAQDETGALTDEVIAELAQRLDLTELEVRNVISYYSMLTTKPRGKYNVQVCTNISCMLRGSQEVVDRIEKKLGIKTGESTPDGRIYLKREEECLAACTGAPMLMVDHVYHEHLTPESIDRILDELK
jgi:NADH-quinone oxidoreductase subunit E